MAIICDFPLGFWATPIFSMLLQQKKKKNSNPISVFKEVKT